MTASHIKNTYVPDKNRKWWKIDENVSNNLPRNTKLILIQRLCNPKYGSGQTYKK